MGDSDSSSALSSPPIRYQRSWGQFVFSSPFDSTALVVVTGRPLSSGKGRVGAGGSVRVIWVGSWRECYISCRSFEPSFHSRRNNNGNRKSNKGKYDRNQVGMKTTSTSRPTNGTRWICNHAIHPWYQEKNKLRKASEWLSTKTARSGLNATYRAVQDTSQRPQERRATRGYKTDVAAHVRLLPAETASRLRHPSSSNRKTR